MNQCYVCHVQHNPPAGSPHPERLSAPLARGPLSGYRAQFPYTVTMYRGEDGVPVVEIDTDDAAQPADHAGNGAPFVRIYVNDALVYGLSPGDDSATRE